MSLDNPFNKQGLGHLFKSIPICKSEGEPKVGVLVACGKCQTVNRTPGIAMQTRATESQLGRMRRSLKRLRLVLWLAVGGVALVILAAVLPDVDRYAFFVAYLVGVGFLICLLLCMTDASGFLGYSRGMVFFLFLAFMIGWVGMTLWTYFRLRTRVRLLIKNGPRQPLGAGSVPAGNG